MKGPILTLYDSRLSKAVVIRLVEYLPGMWTGMGKVSHTCVLELAVLSLLDAPAQLVRVTGPNEDGPGLHLNTTLVDAGQMVTINGIRNF